MSKLSLAITSVIAVLALSACGDDAPATATAATGGQASTKAAQVQAAPKVSGEAAQAAMDSVHAMRRNDIKGMLRAMMPAKQLAELQQKWDETRKEPVTEADRKEFAEGVGKLLAPNAVDDMMKEFEPKLAELKTQLPMYTGMAAMAGQSAIQSSETMNDEQKKQATAMLSAVQAWAGKTDFADPARLRKALNEFANGVRATKITSVDQMRGMNFDQMLEKGGVMFAATKRAFNAYDFNMDDMMSSYKVEQISMAGDVAKVRSTVTMFGQTITSDAEMIKQDGRWFSKEMMDGMSKVSEQVTGSKLEQPAGG